MSFTNGVKWPVRAERLQKSQIRQCPNLGSIDILGLFLLGLKDSND
jgi:hypothetical protein